MKKHNGEDFGIMNWTLRQSRIVGVMFGMSLAILAALATNSFAGTVAVADADGHRAAFFDGEAGKIYLKGIYRSGKTITHSCPKQDF